LPDADEIAERAGIAVLAAADDPLGNDPNAHARTVDVDHGDEPPGSAEIGDALGRDEESVLDGRVALGEEPARERGRGERVAVEARPLCEFGRSDAAGRERIVRRRASFDSRRRSGGRLSVGASVLRRPAFVACRH
jgi:hypothetical protein